MSADPLTLMQTAHTTDEHRRGTITDTEVRALIALIDRIPCHCPRCTRRRTRR